jgi:hypothetical protein
MRRWVSSAARAGGDAEALRSVFAGDPARWLPPPADPLDDQRWAVQLRGAGLGWTVACHVLAARADGEGCWRHVVWDPEPGQDGGAPLPRLEAELGLVGAQLILSGTYVPPFGVLGLAADVAVLHRVAATTVRTFLGDLTRALTTTTTGRTSS